jgi:hypothetical protein
MNWIPINERLPDLYQSVVTYSYSFGIVVAWRANDGEKDLWTLSKYLLLIDTPTHWMPLPPAPAQ